MVNQPPKRRAIAPRYAVLVSLLLCVVALLIEYAFFTVMGSNSNSLPQIIQVVTATPAVTATPTPDEMEAKGYVKQDMTGCPTPPHGFTVTVHSKFTHPDGSPVTDEEMRARGFDPEHLASCQ